MNSDTGCLYQAVEDIHHVINIIVEKMACVEQIP